MDHKFLQIYGTLPRAGPGANELTARAFRLMSDLPDSPKILDVGCGPGMQTIELLKLSKAEVVALDLLPEMLTRLEASAKAAGVADRLTTIEKDMTEMSFPEASFDAIWCESAIYILGFEAGLKKLKPFLKSGGYLAVSEVVWLKPDPPAEAVEFWKEYPDIDTAEAKIKLIEKAGYKMVDHFIFPPYAWTDNYYDPMEKRIEEREKQWSGDKSAEQLLKKARNEINVFRNCYDYYSYAFFVMRTQDNSCCD